MLDKACDICNLRKSKCTGGACCHRCERLGLACTYHNARKKKGPKPKLRAAASRPEEVVREVLPITPSTANQAWSDDGRQAQSVGLLLPSVIDQRSHSSAEYLLMVAPILQVDVEHYLKHVYPLAPVVDPDQLRLRFACKHYLYDKQFAALVLAMSAHALIGQSRADPQRPDLLAVRAVELHASASLDAEGPSLDTVSTAMILGGYLKAKGSDAASYVRTREAMALADVLKLDQASTYDNFSAIERETALAIYWKLSVADRSNALLSNRPVISKKKAAPLARIFTTLSPFTARLAIITSMFDIVEGDVIACINGRCGGLGCAFDREKALEIFGVLNPLWDLHNLSHVQIVDVMITRLWLSCRTWQACVSHSLLDISRPEACLQVGYPLMILAAVDEIIEGFDHSAFSGNGRAMSVKLREIANCISLVVTLPLLQPGLDAWPPETLSKLERIEQKSRDLESCRWTRSQE